MSKIEVDTIDTQSSTTLQVGSTNTSLIKIGTSGDTVEYPAGTTFTQSGTQNVTAGGAITVKSGGNITIDSGATITNNGTATGFSADLTNLNATNLTSGTVPDARFPSVLPAVSGANLTNIAGQLQWQSGIITASTASVGNNLGYWVDTTSNACVITLPGSAAVGDRIILTDYARTWGTNSVTINPNSLKFQGFTTPQPVYDTSGQSVDIVYSGATKGWIPNSDDDVTLETPQSYSINFLVVAGGGPGGGATASSTNFGAGGGAGGYRTSSESVSPGGGTVTITVGAGGAGALQVGTNGGDSIITGGGITSLTSTGGGSGAPDGLNANNGGSGGGAGQNYTAGISSPVTSPVQGYAGGLGTGSANYGMGGGGGAGAVGGAGSTTSGGAGGVGVSNSITGSAVFYAGGGGGSIYQSGTVGPGGNGGGGDGSIGAGAQGTDGLGGGGGGSERSGGANAGGDGGNGVVILSMPSASFSGTTTGSPSEATSGSNKILTFTGSGSYTF